MRHITPGRLDGIEPLLEQLRTIDGLTEKRRGAFYRRSKAFLHFHEHGDDIYADLRVVGTDFERRRVTTATERKKLVADIRRAVK